MKLILALLLALSASPIHAQSLRDDAHVTQMLVAAQVGDILRKTCPDVSARMFTVFLEMNALRRHAEGMGHTEDTMRAFLNDKAEKKRIRALADAYLQTAGAKAGDTASYCAVALAEVANETVTGSLIEVDN